MFFMFISLIMTLMINMISWLSFYSYKDINKSYSFECGFDPYLSPRTPFSIQFFKILLIFIMFDMEIIIILPIPLTQSNMFFKMIMTNIIIIFLILGLLFEWKEGVLKWTK